MTSVSPLLKMQTLSSGPSGVTVMAPWDIPRVKLTVDPLLAAPPGPAER